MLILFLGRNTEGILRDAQREFPQEQEVLVVCRDGDQLEPPAGLRVVSVGEFQPDASGHYVVIANGGTSQQLLPVVKRLVESGAPFQAFDLQRDGVTRVW